MTALPDSKWQLLALLVLSLLLAPARGHAQGSPEDDERLELPEDDERLELPEDDELLELPEDDELLKLPEDAFSSPSKADDVLPEIPVEAAPIPGEAEAGFDTTLEVEDAAAQGEALGEVLERAPGVHVKDSGSSLQPQEVQIRGASGQQVVVLLQGMRLNSLGGGAFDLSMIPLAALRRAVVTRGGGASRFGSGAQGGVVSLSLADPPAGQKTSVHASLGLGAWLRLRAEAAVGAALDEGRAIHGGAVWERSEGDFDFVDAQGSLATRENNDGQRASGFFTLRWPLGEGELHIGHLTSWLSRGAPGPSEFPTRFSEARCEGWQSVTSLSAAWPLTEDEARAWLLDTRLSHRAAGDRYENPKALLGGEAIETESQEQSAEAELGVERWAGAWSKSRAALIGRFETMERSPERLSEEPHRALGALQLLQSLRLARGVLQLEGALRVEAAEGEIQPIPSLGIGLHPSPWLTFELNLGRAYRLPTFHERYSQTEFVRGDPDLSSEASLHADLGLRAEGSAGWLEIAAFYSDYEDLILFVPATALYYQAVNLPGAESRGLELDAGVHLWGPLSLEGGYTYTRARQEEPPFDPLPGRPTHQANGTLRLANESLSLALEGQWVGARTLDLFGTREEEGVLWLDLGASFTWRTWRLSVRLNNLLDVEDSVDSAQLPLPGFGWFTSLSYQG